MTNSFMHYSKKSDILSKNLTTYLWHRQHLSLNKKQNQIRESIVLNMPMHESGWQNQAQQEQVSPKQAI